MNPKINHIMKKPILLLLACMILAFTAEAQKERFMVT